LVAHAYAEAGTAPSRTRKPDDPVSRNASNGSLSPIRIGTEKRIVPFELVRVTVIGTSSGPPAQAPPSIAPGTSVHAVGSGAGPEHAHSAPKSAARKRSIPPLYPR